MALGEGLAPTTGAWLTAAVGETWVPWGVALVLLTAVILLSAAIRRERSRAGERAARQAVEAARQDEERLAEHRADMQRRDAEASTAAAELARYKHAAVARIEHELVSRDAIVGVCRELGIDGVLATNVMFVTSDARSGAPFLTQVDHVLVTDGLVVVIENKYWKGLVFDDVLPGSVHPSFSALVPHEVVAESPSFAVSIVRASDDAGPALSLLVHTGRRAPRSQVRLHAKRLSDLFRSRLGSTGWIDTAVYYSHPEIVLHAAARSRGGGSAETRVAAGPAQLRSVIADMQRSRSQAAEIPVADIAGVLTDQGADVLGFGSLASDYPSMISGADARSARREAAGHRTARMQGSLPPAS